MNECSEIRKNLFFYGENSLINIKHITVFVLHCQMKSLNKSMFNKVTVENVFKRTLGNVSLKINKLLLQYIGLA